MRVSLIVALALLMTATVATAQHHATSNVQIVDGREHAELIPDGIAYQNYFLRRSITANASDEERKDYNKRVATVNLSPEDEIQFRVEMSNYRTKFDALLHTYNIQAEKGLATPDQFWTKVFKLVNETRINLETKLSPIGVKQYESGVQVMREHTRYIPGGAQ